MSRIVCCRFHSDKSRACNHPKLRVQFVLMSLNLCHTSNNGDNCCIKLDALLHKCFFFQWLTAQREINVITSYGMNALKSFGLIGHWEFQIGDIYVRQSKAEQWLRLVSVLMNANWHICYGGLAVQTLQLAWLINYPPAGGSLEMEAREWAGGVWIVGGGIWGGGVSRRGDERTWEKIKNASRKLLALSECDFLFITLWDWKNILSLNNFILERFSDVLTESNISRCLKVLIRDQRDQIRWSD